MNSSLLNILRPDTEKKNSQFQFSLLVQFFIFENDTIFFLLLKSIVLQLFSLLPVNIQPIFLSTQAIHLAKNLLGWPYNKHFAKSGK